MRKNIFPVCLFISSATFAQPYIDLGKISYVNAPEKGLNKKTNPLRSDFYNINLTAPIELQKNGDAVIINPFFEHNEGKIADRKFHVVSQGASIGFLNKLKNTKWSIYTAFILRRNKEAEKKPDDIWQYGGVALATVEKNKNLSFKFGLYYNKEFFGNYFMPLAGIDWKINEKNNLFGVLPGNMTFEHKISQAFYFGGIFKAFTNSYRLVTIDPCFSGDCSAKNYLRINDNQLGVFADVYLSKRIVVSSEIGYTAFRTYRFGFKGKVVHLKNDYKNDNYYIRLSMSYRLRFR